MKQLYLFLKYIKYWFFAKTAHGIHSPFVFELVTEVINKKGVYYSFEKIEQLRRKSLVSLKEIDVTDLGTGKSGKRTVCEIAERSLKSAKYGQLLFRLAYHFKPDTILELGTSLGISASYLASANPNSKVITMEGCPNTANEARKIFKSLGLNNIESVVGNFDDDLSAVLCQLPALASSFAGLRRRTPPKRFAKASVNCLLVFFDGNHRKASTLKYFLQCIEYAHNDSVFIFDDIHWSDEMEEAWEEIKKHPQTTVTIDLFKMGIVFFRQEQVKQHFAIRF